MGDNSIHVAMRKGLSSEHDTVGLVQHREDSMESFVEVTVRHLLHADSERLWLMWSPFGTHDPFPHPADAEKSGERAQQE